MYQELSNSVMALAAELMQEDSENEFGTFPSVEHGLMLLQSEARDFTKSCNEVVNAMQSILDKYGKEDIKSPDYFKLEKLSEYAATEAVYLAVLTDRMVRMEKDRILRATQEELDKFWEDK